MILPTAAAAAIALATIAATAWALTAAWLHGTFAPDPGIHRRTAEPGSDAYKTIHTTTQRIPEDVLRQILAGPKEHR